MLADVDPAHLRTAIARHMNESEERWFPAVGRLRRYAAEAACGTLPGWEAAWHRIMQACDVWDAFDRQRAFKARDMLGPELGQFVRMLGGFDVLTCVDRDALSVIQSNFRSAWESQRKTAETMRALPEPLRPTQHVIPEMPDDPDIRRIVDREATVKRLLTKGDERDART